MITAGTSEPAERKRRSYLEAHGGCVIVPHPVKGGRKRTERIEPGAVT